MYCETYIFYFNTRLYRNIKYLLLNRHKINFGKSHIIDLLNLFNSKTLHNVSSPLLCPIYANYYLTVATDDRVRSQETKQQDPKPKILSGSYLLPLSLSLALYLFSPSLCFWFSLFCSVSLYLTPSLSKRVLFRA